MLVNKKQSKAYSKPQWIDLPNSFWCHGEQIRGYQVRTRELEAPLLPLFPHNRKISKQNSTTLSPDENSKIENLTNWIELPNPGLAKDFNKIEVSKLKGFETEVNDFCKFNFESFQKKTYTFEDWQVPIHKINKLLIFAS